MPKKKPTAAKAESEESMQDILATLTANMEVRIAQPTVRNGLDSIQGSIHSLRAALETHVEQLLPVLKPKTSVTYPRYQHDAEQCATLRLLFNLSVQLDQLVHMLEQTTKRINL